MRTGRIPYQRGQRAHAVHPGASELAPNPPAQPSTKQKWLAVLRAMGSASWLCFGARYPWRVSGWYGCANLLPTRSCSPGSDGVRTFTMARCSAKSPQLSRCASRQHCCGDQISRPPPVTIRAEYATAAAARRRSESVNSRRIRRDGILRETRWFSIHRPPPLYTRRDPTIWSQNGSV